MKNKLKIQFANATVAGLEACIGFSNEVVIGADGWAQIAPFGDFPSFAVLPQADGSVKRMQVIQRIDKECATQMVNEFQSGRKGLKKFFAGRPIYVGHPDVPGIGAKYPDKAPKGVIADLAVRADGLYGMPVFTNEGSELVEQKKLRFFSGRLADCDECDPVNETRVFRPNLFISVGLTNQPHLPVQMLNEADACAAALEEQSNNETKMKKTLLEKIIGLCTKAGIELANTADEAAVEAALDKLSKVDPAATFANERTTWETTTGGIKKKLLGLAAAVKLTFANESEITDIAATVAQIEEKVKTLGTEHQTALTSFANERADRIKDELGLALTSGRITAAEQATWQSRLNVAAQFANELTALRALKPTVKTDSITINRGDRKVELANASERREMLAELVNEEMTTNKVDYDTAFSKVQKRFPQLFEAMAQPEKSSKKK